VEGSLQLVEKDVDIRDIRIEILSQLPVFKENTARQRTIKAQRETESVFLRSAERRGKSDVALEDIHDCTPTGYSADYPLTMGWIEAFAERTGGAIGRALLAKLPPFGRVFRHTDVGEYYRVRDRFHLVIYSPNGTSMVCGGQQVLANEAELWWLNNKKPHESFNPTQDYRIHLIFDLLGAQWRPIAA
jgi:hypothetical protein